MPTLKYLDTATGTYKPLYGPPGPLTPYPSLAFASYTRKAALSFATSTQVLIPWDTVETAASGISLAANTTDFTIQSDGTYLISASLSFPAAVNTGYTQIRIIKNGVLWDYNAIPSDDVVGYQVLLSRQMKLVAGDVIQIATYCNPAASLVVSPTYNTNSIQITKISPTAPTVPASIEIPNAADLNTYTTPGVYTQSNTAEAQAGTNYPAPVIAGLLEVFSNSANMVWQRYTAYPGNVAGGGYVHERGSYNSVWTAWQIVGGNVDAPDPIDTYISTDQTITATAGGTETPTAIRASMVNPHPTKRLLVRVDVQARGITTGPSGGACAYFGPLTISGASNAVPAFESCADANFVQANMVGYVYSWIAAAGTGVYGMYCSKGSTGFTLLIRYCHTSIIPIRYEN